MISRYADRRGLRRYLAGAAVARAGDEMSGPALLLLGFAVTGRPETGSGLLAGLTIAGAAGGPLFGRLHLAGCHNREQDDRKQANRGSSHESLR